MIKLMIIIFPPLSLFHNHTYNKVFFVPPQGVRCDNVAPSNGTGTITCDVGNPLNGHKNVSLLHMNCILDGANTGSTCQEESRKLPPKKHNL